MTSNKEDYENLCRSYADNAGIDAELFTKQMAVESCYFDPDVIAGRKVSPVGAQGIAQIMPYISKRVGVDPLDVHQALNWASKEMWRHLRNNKGDWTKALACYNWGEGNLKKYGMKLLPKETRTYIKRITGVEIG